MGWSTVASIFGTNSNFPVNAKLSYIFQRSFIYSEYSWVEEELEMLRRAIEMCGKFKRFEELARGEVVVLDK